jgi:hypothetical protein
LAAKIGLSQLEIDDAIRASAADTRTDAILKLARNIVVHVVNSPPQTSGARVPAV